MNYEGAENVLYEKEKEENVENEHVESHPPAVQVEKASMDIEEGEEHH